MSSMHRTIKQRVKETFPKAFSYDVGKGKGFVIASHDYGSIIGRGKTRAAAWMDALAGVIGRQAWEREFG